MIKNQWYVILESRELKNNKPLKIKRFGEYMVLWRDDSGRACCIHDRCCHLGASLSCGRIVDGKMECPFHGFLYDGTGRVTRIPANGKSSKVPESQRVRSFQTHERQGFIWLWWGDNEKISGDPFFFEELTHFSYSTFIDHWDVHYSRAIENQLDVVHLPFVHKTTIGRGNKTLVNGPVVTREGSLLTFYVDNREDDGKTVPLKPNEIPDFEKLFHLKFYYPNIWQNCISDKVRVFAAFVPVDEEHTIIYLRFYQRFVRLPLLRELINYLAKLSNIVILRQDKRVVITQIPKKSEVKMDERLIMGDKPIIEYRKYRQTLLEAHLSVG
ncbi:MAG TPA: aromatic ring-hydroxylating dioxygenase subunit alpha [Prolixibacteraceae bacterium]|nr:aromatic ring-hydroxylating dioxygenase subunit alpha [Prolixibacteraceae bacterium]